MTPLILPYGTIIVHSPATEPVPAWLWERIQKEEAEREAKQLARLAHQRRYMKQLKIGG